MQKRYCLALDLRKDSALIRQYKHVHTKEGIWPEIPKGIKEVGISDMEIYLWDNRMFMILEAPLNWDYDSQMARLGTLAKQKEWSDYVWQFQQFIPYSKNRELWMPMTNVFHLNPNGLKGTAESGYTEPVYDKPTKRFCAIADVKDNTGLISQYRHYKAPAGILDLQIYLIGSRLFMIMETPPGYQWEKQKDWELMENVFDLNRDF